MKKKTNFDLYLEEQLKDKDFAARFKKVGDDWRSQSVTSNKKPRKG